MISEFSTILDAAYKAGIPIKAPCGASFKCLRCLVKITDGNYSFKQELPARFKDKDLIPSCFVIPQSDMIVEVPFESRLHEGQTQIKETYLPEINIEPVIINSILELPCLTNDDCIDDVLRLKRKLKMYYINFSIDAIKNLPYLLRKNNFNIGITRFQYEYENRLIAVFSPAEISAPHYGLAIDIGTTTVVSTLINLKSGEALSTISIYNKQGTFGEDVLSRILFAENDENIQKLRKLAIDSINETIKIHLVKTGINKDQISMSVVTGNTIMTHLFLGLTCDFIRETPHVPILTSYPIMNGKDSGIDMLVSGIVYITPSVAGYVGGDITSGVIASRLAENEKISLLIDVGTNGEIVLGNKDFVACVSTSAGPAFEGGELSCGVHAQEGAIEEFYLENNEIKYGVIGACEPIGICGSGIIDLIAIMFKQKIIDRAGNISEKYITKIDGVRAYRIPVSSKKELHIFEADIKNIIRTKAALYAGASVLLKKFGMEFKDIDGIFIAGGFGSYIDIENAITIGLFPDVECKKFILLGNASLIGAKMALLNGVYIQEMETLRKLMTYIDLSNEPLFNDEYSAALFIPHTKADLFPNIKI